MIQRFACILFLSAIAPHLFSQLIPKLGKQRAGISALTFLKIDPSPRSSAMGGANLTLPGDGFSAYYNPAGISELQHTTFTGSNAFWVAGINVAFASVAKEFGKAGHFALSTTSLTTGKMERRTEFQPGGTGEYFYASNTAIGLSYSRKLTDWFSFGGTIKYVHEQLAEYSAQTALLDLGFLYTTDFKNLRFAVLLQNFGTDSRLKGSYSPAGLQPREVVIGSYPAPTVFELGISMVPWKTENHSLLTAVQLNHPNDNAENIRLGVEYEYKQILFIRAGYKINVRDQNYPAFGAGLRTRIGKHPLQLDFGSDPTRYLGWMHRAGITFSLNKDER